MIINSQLGGATPEIYRVFRNNNGTLANSITTPFQPLPNTITDVSAYLLRDCYKGTPAAVLSGAIDLSSLVSVSGGHACSYMFANCPGITSVDLSSLTTSSAQDSCSYMFQNCTGITSINLSSLTTVSASNACSNMFSGCTKLTSVDLSNLTTISGANGCSNMFRGCTSLTSINLSKLTNLSGNSACASMFSGCTALTSVSFPALTSNSFGATMRHQFNFMASGLTGFTIHFPSNLDPDSGSTLIPSLIGYPNFGGTDTVLLYDLPATS